VYSRYENDECVIIFLYVDDMLIFCTCDDIVFKTNFFLGSKFEMKDVGETSVIIRVKIIRKGESILLSQKNTMRNFLRSLVTIVSNPYDANSKLKKNIGESIS